MIRILVTNDDGYRSDGIQALGEALRAIGQVVTVAPVLEASAIGHALTLRRPLRLEAMGDDLYAVDGTPTDCVNIAVTQVFLGLPDLVVSGINKGWNLGDDVTYSGTVAGALEAALLGIPALAVSLRQTRGAYDFSHAARAAALLAENILRRPLPPRTFLNINVPKGQPKGYRVTVQATRNHVTSVAERHDPKGHAYFWIEEGQNEWQPHDRSDYQAVRDGYVSITPLHPDLTAHHALAALDAQTVRPRSRSRRAGRDRAARRRRRGQSTEAEAARYEAARSGAVVDQGGRCRPGVRRVVRRVGRVGRTRAQGERSVGLRAVPCHPSRRRRRVHLGAHVRARGDAARGHPRVGGALVPARLSDARRRHPAAATRDGVHRAGGDAGRRSGHRIGPPLDSGTRRGAGGAGAAAARVREAEGGG